MTGFLTLGQVKRLERAFADANYFTLADAYVEERFTGRVRVVVATRHSAGARARDRR